MTGWRTWPAGKLSAAAESAESAGDHEKAEKYWAELEARDEQAEANAGGMNGVPPQY
jgi:hypothetical protein